MFFFDLKTKTISKKVTSALNHWDAIGSLKELYNIFVSVPIDKAANTVAIIYTRSHELAIAQELRLNNENYDNKNDTYE